MRVGLSQRIGKGTSVHVGKNINPGGCVKWLLYFIFLPFILIYLYIKWCIRNNNANSTEPIYKRAWIWTTIVLLVIGVIGTVSSKRNPNQQTASSVSPNSYSNSIAQSDTGAFSSSTENEYVESNTSPADTSTDSEIPPPESFIIPAPNEQEREAVVSNYNEPVPQAPTEQPAPPETQSQTVYIASSGNGTKYHRSSVCGRMKNSTAVSLDQAIAAGYTACEKCC